jgi:hypothetical protein
MVSLAANSSNSTAIGARDHSAWGFAVWVKKGIFAFCSPLRYNAAMREKRRRPPVIAWWPAERLRSFEVSKTRGKR